MKCPTCKKKHYKTNRHSPYCSEACFYKMSYEKYKISYDELITKLEPEKAELERTIKDLIRTGKT